MEAEKGVTAVRIMSLNTPSLATANSAYSWNHLKDEQLQLHTAISFEEFGRTRVHKIDAREALNRSAISNRCLCVKQSVSRKSFHMNLRDFLHHAPIAAHAIVTNTASHAKEKLSTAPSTSQPYPNAK
jgi:hypothetical protein